MGETPNTGSSCKQYLGNELVINENQSWNTEKTSGQEPGIHLLKNGCSVNPDTGIINMGCQIGLYGSNSSHRLITRGKYELLDDTKDLSTKTKIDQKKQFDIVSSGYVTPRTEYVSPTPEISSSGENYGFHSNQSPAGIGTGTTYLNFRASTRISEADLACSLYSTASNNNSNTNSPIGPKEVLTVPSVQNTGEEPKSPSIPQEIGQEFTYLNITRKERIYSEYQIVKEKDVCVYNLEESNNRPTIIEVPDNSGARENTALFGPGVGVESPPADCHNIYYCSSNSVQPCVGSSESSSVYLYDTPGINREGNSSCQPAIIEYIDYNAPSASNYVSNKARTSLCTQIAQENMHGAGGIAAYSQNNNNYTGNHCNYSIYESSTPPSSHLNLNNQVIQSVPLRGVDLNAEHPSQYQTEQTNEVYDRFLNPNMLIGGRVSGVTGLPAPPILATPPGLVTPPNIPVISGMDGFHVNNVQNSLQVFTMCQMEASRIENGDENCVRKRRRSGTVGSDRNFYIVDFICEIPINIKNLFAKNVKESKEGSRILREFSLGSLAMRRSGNLAPTVIKCFFHSYRDGISRLQCKSKRHEGRPFLFVINETKLSRPWVFCPNVKCIRRAKSSGKLKGRIKVYEYCPGSDKMVLSPTFLKCARGFLTSDYYFCATLCPQQKYADHESNFWGEDFSTGFGGNRIQETLVGETENGGSGLPLADYILFCNSKHQFVATFRRFPIGARYNTPPLKNSSYVNTSSPDKIFGDETELNLVKIMTSVIRTLEGSNEPTIYTSTDKYIQEVSINPGGATVSQANGFNRQIMQPINLRDCSFGNSLKGNSISMEPDEANLSGETSESVLRRGIEGNVATGKWNENPNSLFSGVRGFQHTSDPSGGQYIYNSGNFMGATKDEKANVYVSSSSLDIEDPFSSKLETYSTGYTDEDSFSTFNDSGAQISFNFDPQDALVVESSTNWVLDVLLNKSSDRQNPQTLASHQSVSFSTDLNSFDHSYDTSIKNQSSSMRSMNQNPSIVENNASNNKDGLDYENENISTGNDNHSY
ncbi:uncharacterized protein cubi_03236 [Cryptosporidium ubiquitum]|uniref:Uncharacterized protein n=1 Tax=Cryptosporidium ubiquitum TaxID=857276 RepID=A0A1J4M9P7_9CRYT|nr:uncharacterized protein cubi_03236 [Cryptosporidium ubiquitum]OII70938.1 hypothetical protein cubi_03236 [Cryptosporidium ubiquitum]